MADIIKIKKDGVVQYPITKPECVIDENGKNVLQLIRENAGGGSYDDTEIKQELAELSEKVENINPTPMVSVTYAELVALRDNGELIAGMQYRITDYVTTTAQENTRSAGHQFDVIVTADNENTLNEVARACRSEFDIEKYKAAYSNTSEVKMLYVGLFSHDGKEYHLYESEDHFIQMLVDFNAVTRGYPDTSSDYPYINFPSYTRWHNEVLWGEWFNGVGEGETICFKHDPTEATYFNSSNLAAWQIWYSLDNDAERFAWADAQNGKGVIYRMIDEWNNDIPYDFKNIQFKRNLNFDDGLAQFSEDSVETWVYTFAGQSYHINNDEWSGMLDGSLESPFGHMSDENTSTFHDNIIGPYIMLYNGNDIYTECGLRYLNDNVFLGYWEKIGSANDEDMPYYYAYCCYSNSFGNNCHSNSFGNNCYSNSFGNDCYSNSFGNYCRSNSFGNNCRSNSFGNYCYYNSFGNDCYSNSFGNDCYSNSFGNYCNSNSFGNYCYYNSFGNYCYSLELNESTSNKTASVNSSGEAKVFNLADLADLLNS